MCVQRKLRCSIEINENQRRKKRVFNTCAQALDEYSRFEGENHLSNGEMNWKNEVISHCLISGYYYLCFEWSSN